MAKRNKRNGQRRKAGRRGGSLPSPKSIVFNNYTGTLNGPGTVSLAIPTISVNDYRVNNVQCQMASDSPTQFQVMIQGETSTIPGPINLCSQQIRRVRVSQPRSEGYWQGTGKDQSLCIITNLGKAPIAYNIIISYTSLYRAIVPTMLQVDEVKLPVSCSHASDC